MAIRWDQLGKQLLDWGGDYDIFDDFSVNGGARDASPRITRTGGVPTGFSTQGATKAGYDATGRLVSTNPTEDTGGGGGGNTGTGGGSTNIGGGGGGVVTPDRSSILRGQAGGYLDELLSLYQNIIEKIKKTGADATGRINTSYDNKILDQVNDLNQGLYSVDVASAASNLADSSFRSADRDRVQKASDANVATLNDARQEALSTVGQQVNTDTAKYMADREGVDRTRGLLGSMDQNELQESVNTLDATRRGVKADLAKYDPRGRFAQDANALAEYDTSALDKTLQAVIANTTASGATKGATINDIIDGTGMTDDQKNKLKNKYSQIV